MFEISLYTFSKHENSTKRPDAAGSAFSCDIVTPSSIIAPSVVLHTQKDLTSFNYAHIEAFSRYYHITDISYSEGSWTLNLVCDVLATYKNEIGETPLYILRSAAESNGYLIDKYYPLTGKQSSSAQIIRDTAIGYNGGYFVINVAGTQTTGNTTLYQLSATQFKTLIGMTLGVIDSHSFVDIGESIKASMFKPMEYITSVLWFPEPFPTSGLEPVIIGLWNSGMSAGVVSQPYRVNNYSLSLPKHPQAARGKYLNSAPYTKYQILFPPFGIIEIDNSQLLDIEGIDVGVYIDAITGAATLSIIPQGAAQTLANITAQWGVPMPMQGSETGAGVVTGIASAIGGLAVAAVNPIAGAGMAIAGLQSFADSIGSGISNVGSSGNIMFHMQPTALLSTFFEIAPEDNARNGRPLCEVRTPASLGGFMMAQRGDVEAAATLDELNSIRSYLEGGFYYE